MAGPVPRYTLLGLRRKEMFDKTIVRFIDEEPA
jgi:hypothetical protein